MTSKLTREKAQWLHDACEEAAAAGIKLTMNPNELLMFTSYVLAAMDGEPIVFTDERNLHHIAMGRETSLIWGKQNHEAGDIPLYRHAQPAPEKYNIGDATMRHIFTPTGMTNVSDMQAVFDRVEAVFVGMEQPAPVVPDGLLSMAASAIEDLLEHTDPNTSYYSGVWADVPGKLRAAMIAAVPQEVKP
ncbi:hypothetical protein AB3X26_10930 [Raoultella planticola]|uniref:hypothetical protein n=1 Tax=Raoultella planticola TaxID=575 RepID=UPI00349FBAC5